MKIILKIVNGRYFVFLLFILYFLIPVIIYWHLYRNGQVFVDSDGIQFFSMKTFFNDSLKSGVFPFWNPLLSNGVPYAADMNGAFYPVQWLLFFLPTKMYVYCYYSLHLAVGSVFMYLYIKEIGCGRVAAFCTSIIYLMSIHLGGFRKSHMSIITAIVFLPIILYFIERYIRTKQLKYLLFSAFAMALQFLSGSVQYLVYTDIAVFGYLLYMGIRNRIPVKKMIKDGFIWFITYIGISAVQLIPLAEIVKQYQQSGAGQTSYDTFITWSINPIKSLMMVFPHIFGSDVYESFGNLNSSEMDIEIFLGVGMFIFILFAAIYYFKNYRVRVSIIFMIAAFIYCAQAHIPIISKALFKIPIINGFRCSGRALFIFIFFAYVLFAISLSKLRETQNIKKMCKFATIFYAVLILIIVTAGITLKYVNNSIISSLKITAPYYKNAFLPAFIATSITLGALWAFYIYQAREEQHNYKIGYFALAIVMTLLTIYETYPYSTISTPTSIDALNTSSQVKQQIKQDIGDQKLWLDFNSFDGSYPSLISANSNVVDDISAINSYIAFNNPRLFRLFTNSSIMAPSYNFSGLLTGFLDAHDNLIYQNDLLSMLGVKYILDPENFIDSNGSACVGLYDGEKLLSIDEVDLVKSGSTADTVWLDQPITMTPNTIYKITFNMDVEESSDNHVEVDFYGGPTYDFSQQEKSLSVEKGKHQESFYLNSGNTLAAQDGKTFLRIYSIPSANVKITDLTATQMKQKMQAGVYKPYLIDEQNRIFENTNAKDILYTPKKLESIKSTDEIYDNVLNYNLADTSYIVNYKNRDISAVTTQIKVLEHDDNSIKASVAASGDTFVNFSQNYYPGWKAYVDGNETKVYMVNGLIQGIEVPKGTHEIVFKFVPFSIYLGAAISLLVLFVAIVLIIVERKKRIKRVVKTTN